MADKKSKFKVDDRVVVAFVDSNSPWSNYAGEATLLKRDSECDWFEEGLGETHWKVKADDKKDHLYFPESALHRLVIKRKKKK
jgi:hypothetical protein